MFGKKKSDDPREAVGQLLIMGFEGTEATARLRSTLATLQPGGVILFARNVASPWQVWELLRECRRCGAAPLFTCVDLEGGTVDRLRDAIAPAPSAAQVFACGSRKLFREHGKVIGDEVRALGFNTDFAPVCDLALEPSRKVLGSRAVSPDPRQTVTYVGEFLAGLRAAHILGCGKHFPGLGEAGLDTHRELPVISKPWKRLWNEDLVPYRALHQHLPFIMAAHAAYPEVTRDKAPASLSEQWLTGILRKKIGYRGLIVSDDLEMGGVLAAASIGEAAVESLRAGADMFLVCHNEEAVWRAYHAVLSQADRDRRFARLVRERAKRVTAFKKKAKTLQHGPPAPTERTIDKLQRAMWEFTEEVRLVTVAV